MPSTDTESLVTRYFTKPGADVFDSVEWEVRDAQIEDESGVIFFQKGVQFPSSWSQNATNIVSQKYFRGKMDSPKRESSVRQMIGRVAATITDWGVDQGYFAPSLVTWGPEAQTFHDELTHILLHQLAAFNSPVWFNVGFEDHPQCSACFILSVEDELDDILDWNTREGGIFRGGSGSGVNLSKVRGSKELLSKGGEASGPVSFMRGADAWAGTISSGGKTRRAAKMVILNDDHPDILEFVRCKALEEERLSVLKAAGLIKGIDETAAVGCYQNANNSVRLSDDLLEKGTSGEDHDWPLLARGGDGGEGKGKVLSTIKASQLLDEIAQASWRCADPGVQYDSTINHWHTSPSSGRINASNPCSEYMHIDDSACNLASLNLLAFRRTDGTMDIESLRHVTDVMTTAMDILIEPASYPDPRIQANAHSHRQLGLGYANLGALLMANGHPYGAEGGRQLAGALTSLIGARCYRQSGIIAAKMGPYKAWHKETKGVESNASAHKRVLLMHEKANQDLQSRAKVQSGAESHTYEIVRSAGQDWADAVMCSKEIGMRNAQATVLAPTGTISFLMDCDTTGVEPDFSLVKYKDLAGGGKMVIVNKTVRMALENFGTYSDEGIASAEEALTRGDLAYFKEIVGRDYRVFKTANEIDWQDHILMMAAVQPFLSGAISKTVNMQESATWQTIREAIVLAWRSGVKALAVYRNNSKGAQPLSSEKAESPKQAELKPRRRRLPKTRSSLTHKATVGTMEFYITAGMYDDGTLGEVFLTDAGKEGTLVSGLLGEWATTVSVALQYGVPLDDLALKYIGANYEPHGVTGNKEIPFATSIPDYIAKWLASQFLSPEFQHQVGLKTPAALEIEEKMTGGTNGHEKTLVEMPPLCDGPPCTECGRLTQRAGACYRCLNCGANTGCG